MNPFRLGSALLLLTLTNAPFPTLAQISHEKLHFIEVGHATVHPAEFPQPIELRFESSTTGQAFTRIRFKSAEGIYTIDSTNSLRRINTPGDRSADTPDFKVPNLRLDDSRYFRIGHYTEANIEHTLMFFMGEAVASDACALLVIGFDPKGHPYKLLEKKSLEVTSFVQSTNDKPALIIGKPTLSQVLGNIDNPTSGPYATTYDPFTVYVLSAPAEKAVYSLEESRLYNQQHYIWAGPNSSETTLVFYNIPKRRKPFAAPAGDLTNSSDSPTVMFLVVERQCNPYD